MIKYFLNLKQVFIFKDIIKKFWPIYVLAIIFSILASILGVIPPFILGIIIDDIINVNNGINAELYQRALILLISMLSIDIISRLLVGLSGMITSTRAEIICHQIRHKFLEMTFHEGKNHWSIQEKDRGEILSLLSRDIDILWDLIGYVLIEMISSVVLLLCVCIVVTIIEPLVGIFFILFTFLFAVAYFDNGRKVRRNFALAAPKFDKMVGLINALFDGYDIIASFRKQKWGVRKTLHFSKDVANHANKSHRRTTVFSFVMGVLTILGIFCIWLISLPSLFNAENAWLSITLGEIIVIIFYFGMLARPLEAIADAAKGYNKGMVSLYRLNDFMQELQENLQKDIKTNNDIVDLFDKQASHDAPILSLKNICDGKNDDKQFHILEAINLDIHAGEMIGLAGASGSGKTTLLRLIANFIPAHGTSPLLLGTALDDMSEDELREKVIYISQQHILFPLTLADNLFIETDNKNRLKEILQKVNLHKNDTFARMEQEEDILKAQFSGGEVQRINFSRIFSANPQLLVIDEPTSALDYENSKVIAQTLFDFSQQEHRAVIVASHDPHILSLCHYVYLLDKGRIICSQTHEQLSKTSELYQNIITS
ncbi:MAG: ABC transporter ATP-binding protein/permease [Alphaproteobacteria bacterium]|nr:ABC transporter ATP-binding protein/permease [Alphaproteobacteria bacterium]